MACITRGINDTSHNMSINRAATTLPSDEDETAHQKKEIIVSGGAGLAAARTYARLTK